MIINNKQGHNNDINNNINNNNNNNNKIKQNNSTGLKKYQLNFFDHIKTHYEAQQQSY